MYLKEKISLRNMLKRILWQRKNKQMRSCLKITFGTWKLLFRSGTHQSIMFVD